MNKTVHFILGLICFVCLFGYACKDDPENTTPERSVPSIYATFEDGSGFFIPESTTPYGDTIKIIVDYHIPLESDNRTDISRMRLNAYAPVKISGVDGIVDLNKPTKVTITAADGTQTSHSILGKFRKFSEAKITSFKLTSPDLEGWVLEDKNIVGIIAGGANLSNRQAELTVSAHATISPDPSLPQDFSKPVVYTITAENGTKINWTVKPITPAKVASGMRKGSGKLLWYKSIEELGLYTTGTTGDPLAHLSISLSVSGDYLLVNTRSITDKYYNRFDGSYAGALPMQAENIGSLKNFFSAGDDAGNILISNLCPNDNVGIPAGTLLVYKWTGVTDAAPVKYIQWAHDFPATPASTTGRKMSIKGDLNRDALIFMGVGNANCTILRWQVIGGVLQSQTPTKIIYPITGSQIAWPQLCDVISAGTQTTDNLFISGFGSVANADNSTLVCFNPDTRTNNGSVPLSASGYLCPHSIDLTTFNGIPYLATMSIGPATVGANLDNYGNAWLYNVSNPALLSTAPTAANYSDVCVFKSETLHSTFIFGNGNRTGDVVLKVSDDGYKMIMYFLVTNAGVAAYEFDCIDLDRLGE